MIYSSIINDSVFYEQNQHNSVVYSVAKDS